MESGYQEYRREFLVRLPLPLAQLYSRAHNAKSPRERHDNTFYLFEATTKLLAITAAAHYLEEVTSAGATRVPAIDRMLAQLALPSLGQWVGILREMTKYIGTRVDRDTHPWGELSAWLHQQRRDCPALLALYRRTKHGPDGEPGGDQQVSVLSALEALVQYRNGVFGHGAGRFESYYAEEMGPLLFPAANELLADPVLAGFGPRGGKLIQITEIRGREDGRCDVELRELVGTQSERMRPLTLPAELAARLIPHRVALLWPGREQPLRLDPLLQYRESDLTEEVLFLNRDRNGRQVEYLSYTTGRTERDRSMLPELAQLLSHVTNRTVQVDDLRKISEQTFSETPSVELLFGETSEAPVQLGEYDVLGELGRGGMGVVYLARQRSLGRLVALKMLPGDLSGDEVALARFRREIRHLARCDDPHIVKVLASGVFPDGRAYYTMEYVQGSDLEQVWRELSGTTGATSATVLGNSTWVQAVLGASRKQRTKTEASTRGVGTGREFKSDVTQAGTANPAVHDGRPMPFVLPPLPDLPDATEDPGGFIRHVVKLARDAANALQSVHDQGIVHRDIKPANLMLTPDGSRLVLMDFGLAKGESQSLAASRQGGLLGTLRYAAPEQLAAANIKIGPAADVRALGVTLWELLTRRRLFGESADEAGLAQEVLTSDVPRLRTIDARFDRDLEAIVARATERRASDRIATAGKLSELLQLWLDGRPLPIRPASVGELTWRWMSEHRGMVVVAAAALLAVVASVVVAFVHVTAARKDAEQALEMAKRQGNLALETLQGVIYDIDNQAASRPSLRGIRRAILEKARDGLDKLGNDLHADSRLDQGQMEVQLKLGRMFAQIGNSEGLGGFDQAETHFHALESIADEILAKQPTDHWALRYRAQAFSERAKICQQLGDLSQAMKLMERCRDIEVELLARDPDQTQLSRNLSATYSWLGNMHLTAGRMDVARDFMDKDLKIAEELVRLEPQVAERHTDLAASYWNLGRWASLSGQLETSIKEFTRGLESASRAIELGATDEAGSLFASAHNRLGYAWLSAGNLEKAEHHFRESQIMLQTLVDRDPAGISPRYELAKSHGALGEMFLTRGQYPAATDAYLQDEQILEQLLKEEPKNAEIRGSLAAVQIELGRIHLKTNQLAIAQEHFSRAGASLETLVEADPKNMQLRLQLADALRTRGEASLLAAELTNALSQFTQSLEIVKALVGDDPENMSARFQLGVTNNWIGNVYLKSNDLKKAASHFLESVENFRTLTELDPKNAQARIQLSKALAALGDLRSDEGDLDAARTEYEAARGMSEELLRDQPRNSELRESLASILRALAYTLRKLGGLTVAMELYQEATVLLEELIRESPNGVDIASQLAGLKRSQGECLLAQGNVQGAMDMFRQAEAILARLEVEHPGNSNLKNELALALNWLGTTEIRLRDLDNASTHLLSSTDLYSQIVAADDSNLSARVELATSYIPLGDLEVARSRREAAKEYFQKGRQVLEETLARDPQQLTALNGLGWLLNSLSESALNANEFGDGRGMAEEAKRRFSQLRVLEPGSLNGISGESQAEQLLGRFELEAKNFSAAREAFQRSLALRVEIVRASPSDVTAARTVANVHGWLAECESRAGNFAKAREECGEWIRLLETPEAAGKEDADARRWLIRAHDYRALASESLKDYPEALVDRDAAVQLAPERAEAWNLRGNTYFAQGNWEAALADYSQAIKLDGTMSMYFRNRAGAYLRHGEPQEALHDLDEALRIAPGDKGFASFREEILRAETAAPSPPEETSAVETPRPSSSADPEP